MTGEFCVADWEGGDGGGGRDGGAVSCGEGGGDEEEGGGEWDGEGLEALGLAVREMGGKWLLRDFWM